MSRLFSTTSALILLALPALADPATQDEATRIQTVFQRYLSDTPGLITVTPEGEAYVLDLDPSVLAAMIPASHGIEISVPALTFTLLPLGEGRWSVTGENAFDFRMQGPDLPMMRYEIAHTTSTGIWNEGMFAYETGQAQLNGLLMEQTTADPVLGEVAVRYTIDSITSTSRATANPNGGVDSSIDMTTTGLAEMFTLPTSDGVTQVDMTVPSYTANITGTGTRNRQLAELLAFGIAQLKSGETPAEDATKAVLRAALPLFDKLRMDGQMQGLEVTTEFGSGGAETVAVAIELNGAVPDGYLREAITLTGLRLPTQLIPNWAHPLLPQDVTLDFHIADFDLAALAEAALDQLSFVTGLPPEFESRLPALLMPKGKVSIGLAGTGLSNAMYDLTMDGEMQVGMMGMPTGQGRIGLTGMKEIADALAEAPEEISAGALPGLAMVRGMSKPDGDAMIWDISATEDGKILINGMDISGFLQ